MIFIFTLFSLTDMTADELAVLKELRLDDVFGVTATAHGNCTEKGDTANEGTTQVLCRSCAYFVELPLE